MRISDWSSDVCSSDLQRLTVLPAFNSHPFGKASGKRARRRNGRVLRRQYCEASKRAGTTGYGKRSEEHTSELQSLMRISYAVFCLKKKKKVINTHTRSTANTRV